MYNKDNLFIFLHNCYRVFIPPSGRRAQPERSVGGVETQRLAVRIGKNYVPQKL